MKYICVNRQCHGRLDERQLEMPVEAAELNSRTENGSLLEETQEQIQCTKTESAIGLRFLLF